VMALMSRSLLRLSVIMHRISHGKLRRGMSSN
jgi:hypothetical protein